MYFIVKNLNNTSDIEIKFIVNNDNFIGLSAIERYNCIRLILAIFESATEVINDIIFDEVSLFINKDNTIYQITYTKKKNKLHYHTSNSTEYPSLYKFIR
ncbi:hypothetical protein CZ814_02524 [Photobacterium toruni]|uniref:Uncharacterized protein n=1 Tax=Photobacterium toruni TaxID=1935446 RepID=A0A1T4TVW4_9GAMM|nr:hypothetical protein CZ814_02524 [Photobacterium toruni]